MNEEIISPRIVLVVPCYNEEDRLRVGRFVEYFRSRGQYFLLFVNDGSQDGTQIVIEQVVDQLENASYLSLKKNVGKAEAVRKGMLEAMKMSPEYIGYWDADLATDLSELDSFLVVGNKNIHIQILLGSRLMLLGRSIRRKALRHYLGRVFATGASLALDLPVYDTQCGAKVFRNTEQLSRVLALPFMSRWIFDVELIARLLRLGMTQNEAYEVSVKKWEDVGGSKVRPLDFFVAFFELVKIVYYYRIKSNKINEL